MTHRTLIALFLLLSSTATATPIDRFRSADGTEPVTRSSFGDALELYLVGQGRADLATPLRQLRHEAGPAAAVQAGGLAASLGLGGASVGAGALAITGGLMRTEKSEQILLVGLGATAVALGLVASAVGPAVMAAAGESYSPNEEAVLFEVVRAFNQDRPQGERLVLMSGPLEVALPGPKGIVPSAVDSQHKTEGHDDKALPREKTADDDHPAPGERAATDDEAPPPAPPR